MHQRQQHRRKFWASIITGTALLVLVGLFAVGTFSSESDAQRSSTPKSLAPVFKSKYTAAQIQTAKKHDDYATFYNAQLIAVGKVVKQQAPVPSLPGAENRPPQFAWVLVTTETLCVNRPFAQKYDEYYLNGRVADADLNGTPFILALSFGERQTYFGRADGDVLQVAAIAIEQRSHDDAMLLHQAKTNPSSHPLFKAIRAAKNIATVDVLDDLAGSVSIDRAGNVEQLGQRIDNRTHIVLLNANLRGKLPEDASVGSHLRVTKPLASPVESQPLIVVWEMNEGRAQATHLATMNEATLRIAAAALKRDFKRLAIDALGPQEGSSRGSNGGGAPDHDHDHRHEHEHAPGPKPGGDPESDPGAK